MADKTDKTTIEEAKLEALNTLDAVKNNQLHYLDILSKASQQAMDNFQNAAIEDIKKSMIKTHSEIWAKAIMDMLAFTPVLSTLNTVTQALLESALISRRSVLKPSGNNLRFRPSKEIKLATGGFAVQKKPFLTTNRKNVHEYFGKIVEGNAQNIDKTVVALPKSQSSAPKSFAIAVANLREELDNWIICNRNTTRITFDRMKNFILSGAYKERVLPTPGDEYRYFGDIKSKYRTLMFNVPHLSLVRSEIEKLIWLTVLPVKIGKVGPPYVLYHEKFDSPFVYPKKIGGIKFSNLPDEVVKFEFSETIVSYMMNNLYSNSTIKPNTKYEKYPFADLQGSLTKKRKQLLNELKVIRSSALMLKFYPKIYSIIVKNINN